MQKQKFSLKDHLFNPVKVGRMASEIESVHGDFSAERFVAEVVSKFPELELKERIVHITGRLRAHLPDGYRDAVEILLRALPAPCNPDLSDDDFGDFIYAPYTHFVAVYGCNSEHLDFSLDALEEITTRFSAEDSIRYFINAFPEETMAKISAWTRHPHYHVRRLASEGTRPKLPWCQKIHIPIETPLPILDALHTDRTRFVTRSVANHLNDIAKTHPDRVIETLKKWGKNGSGKAQDLDFITRHSLRTLIKQGHPGALRLVGIDQHPPVQIRGFSLTDKVKMDTPLEFSFELHADKDATLLIDYILWFSNKAGEANREKVFKFKKLTLKKGESIKLSKSHMMAEVLSTRRLYRGVQGFALQINGQMMNRQAFELY
jgi:3-methyladenine DNA glycosylase AlkC